MSYIFGVGDLVEITTRDHGLHIYTGRPIVVKGVRYDANDILQINLGHGDNWFAAEHARLITPAVRPNEETEQALSIMKLVKQGVFDLTFKGIK